MKRKIIGFDKDEENHWQAKLECCHFQHVRHNPPLTDRKWVLTAEGRSGKLGLPLFCKKCVEENPKDF